MYLYRRKSNGRTYLSFLSLMRSEFNAKTGVRKNVTVKSFGNIDKISAEELRELEEKYGDPNKKAQALRKVNFDRFHAQLHMGSDIEHDLPLFNYAMFLLKPIWEKLMGLSRAFAYLKEAITY